MIDSATYKKEIVRMWDSLRENYQGENNCDGVSCHKCPLNVPCGDANGTQSYNAFDVIEIVEQWSKEHPIITNADKFKEVFGKEPKDGIAEYLCPSFVLKCCPHNGCDNCKKSFWESEYKEPTESEE